MPQQATETTLGRLADAVGAGLGLVASRHGSLVADTISTTNLGLNESQCDAVEVVNHGGSVPFYFTLTGVAPIIGGNDTWVIPAGTWARTVPVPAGFTGTVKLLSADDAGFSITALTASG